MKSQQLKQVHDISSQNGIVQQLPNRQIQLARVYQEDLGKHNKSEMHYG